MAEELQRSPRYIAVLALAAIAILVVGYELRPRQRPSEVVQAPSQIESLRLQRLAERDSLDTMSEHFALVAADQAPRIARVHPRGKNGVFWSPGIVVTSGSRGGEPASTTVSSVDGSPMSAVRFVGGPHVPLAAYRVEGGDPVSVRPSDPHVELDAGQWILAVWQQDDRLAFAPGHYLLSSPVACGELTAREVVTSVDLIEPMAGGGLFDLDGVLVGLILPCDGRVVALSPDSVAQGFVLGSGFDGLLLAGYGMRVGEIDEDLRARYGAAEGVVVTEVWRGYPAAEADLRPGDVIQSLDGSPLHSPRDLQPLMVVAESRTLDVRRGRSEVRVELLTSRPSQEGSTTASQPPAAGILLERPAIGYRVESVLPGTLAADADIRPGDRVVRVDFTTPSSAARVRRILDHVGTEPVFVELERGARRFGLWLEPAGER